MSDLLNLFLSNDFETLIYSVIIIIISIIIVIIIIIIVIIVIILHVFT